MAGIYLMMSFLFTVFTDAEGVVICCWAWTHAIVNTPAIR